MPRETLNDRARKRRIRDREYRKLMLQIKKLDNITDAQIAVLKQIKVAEASGRPVTAASLPDWKALREMGAVREQEGVAVLTRIGAQAANEKGA